MTKTPPGRSRRVFLALCGLAAALFFLLLIARFWHPVYGLTSFLQLGRSDAAGAIDAFRDRPIYSYPYDGSYDGVSYVQIAHHPLLGEGHLRATVDNLGYRARRILPPALAWLASGGIQDRIAHTYAAQDVVVWLLLALVLWRLLPVRDARGWVAWAGLLFSAGALGSVRLALTDLPALAALALAMLAVEASRGGRAGGWLAAAALCRETSLAALPAVFTDGGRGPRGFLARENAARLAVAVIPLAAWMAYVRWATGPSDAGWGNFSAPFGSFVRKWGADLAAVRAHPDPILAWTTLLATAAVTVQASTFALTSCRRSLADPWWRLGVVYATMMLFLGWAVWDGFPGAATRVLLPMSLAFAVLSARRRLPWLLIIAGNLSVPAGLLCLRDTAPHPNEIAAGHAGGVAYVARAETGWYQVERTLLHSRTWSSGPGRMEVETWPHRSGSFAARMLVRSLAPRTITVTENGVLLWKGTVGPVYKPVDFPIRVQSGRAWIEFSTDAPAVQADSGTRRLAFAVRDLALLPVPSAK
jgi:hypothetical protein